jgi:hypothetical protein
MFERFEVVSSQSPLPKTGVIQVEQETTQPDSQATWLLYTLFQAWNNVPPGLESQFSIEDRESGYVVSHPGLEGQSLAPNWIAYRSLLRDGYLRQTERSFDFTNKGVQAASDLEPRQPTFDQSRADPEALWISPGTPDPVTVFCAYSHHDEAHLLEFKKHTAVLERSGMIKAWTDRDISAGTDWEQEIDQHLLNDDIIVLLISADFFHSDYCSSRELAAALERHRSGQARVIPVIVRDCLWKDSPIGFLQAIPKDGQPIIGWANQDAAWADAVMRIRNVSGELSTSTDGSIDLKSNADPKVENENSEPDGLDELVESDEPGLLDLEEAVEDSTNTIVEQLTAVTAMTLEIQSRMQEWVRGLPSGAKSLPSGEKRKLAEEVAKSFSRYAKGVHASAVVIDERFDVFGNSVFAMHQLLDYSNDEQRHQARQLMDSARSLSIDMKPFIQQIESAQTALKAIPPLTKDLRASVQGCNLALGTFANSTRKGLEHAVRIASVIEERLSDSDDSLAK